MNATKGNSGVAGSLIVVVEDVLSETAMDLIGQLENF